MNFWPSWDKSRQRRIALLLSAVGAAALLLGLGVGRLAHTAQKPPLKPEGRLIEFSLPDVRGKPRHIKEWQGRLILLNFWATWCAPCREEIPLLMQMQHRYGPRGLQVIGIAIDRLEAVAAYQNEMKIDYPLLIGEEAFELARQYGNRQGALPFNVLIAPDGRILAHKLGAYHAAELEALLYPHLKPKMQ